MSTGRCGNICHCKSDDIIRLSWTFRSTVHRQTKMKQGVTYQQTATPGKSPQWEQQNSYSVRWHSKFDISIPSHHLLLGQTSSLHSRALKQLTQRGASLKTGDFKTQLKKNTSWSDIMLATALLRTGGWTRWPPELLFDQPFFVHIHFKRLSGEHILPNISCMDKIYQLTDLREKTETMNTWRKTSKVLQRARKTGRDLL